MNTQCATSLRSLEEATSYVLGAIEHGPSTYEQSLCFPLFSISDEFPRHGLDSKWQLLGQHTFGKAASHQCVAEI